MTFIEKKLKLKVIDMGKHEAWELKQMQSLPLEAKIRMTQRRIRDWYDYWDGMVYISFSGGKDSTVLKHIVDSMFDDVPALFVNTGLEYPEIQKFAMSQKNVVTVRPEMRFDEVLKKYGFPVASKETAKRIYELRNHNLSEAYRNKLLNHPDPRKRVPDKWKCLIDAPFETSSKCCDVMKKKPVKTYEKTTGRKPYIGTLACESQLRKTKWLQTGCNAFEISRPSSQPLSFWTEQDILQYLKKYDVPYCSVYGDIVPTTEEEQIEGQLTTFDILNDYEGTLLKTTGCDRTGCIFCLFGISFDPEPNRMQRLKETHPNQHRFCIGGGEMVDGKWQPNKKGLGLGKVLDYIGVNYK